MKKIFVIGGGVDYSNYDNFKDYLLKIDFNPYEEKIANWKDNLKTNLGEGFEVIKIPMPNKSFANYKYWEIMFEKSFLYFGEENILIGHSLGGSFLLKYLNENKLKKFISQIHLVAPAVFSSSLENLGSFTFDVDLDSFKKYEEITNFYFSQDDEIVPFNNYLHLKKVLQNSNFNIFENKGHFVFLENFKELTDNIKNL